MSTVFTYVPFYIVWLVPVTFTVQYFWDTITLSPKFDWGGILL